MGSIYNRGTRDKPNWYVSYKDVDGRRRAKPSKQPTKTQARKYLSLVEARIASGKVGITEAKPVPLCRDLMELWAKTLTNRYAHGDRGRLNKHVLPVFGPKPVTEVHLAMVMTWIDDQRAAGTLADASIRHNLNLLSRFFSWAIERGHASVNPVRQIPMGKRPRQRAKKEEPWIEDDTQVRKLFHALPSPVNKMFYLGNRSGLRTGEIVGLRLSDLGFLDDGVIRVRYSYLGPLKEDKDDTGKLKWVPAAQDCAALMKPWIDQRRAEGAGPEDLVFPSVKNPAAPPRAKWINKRWKEATEQVGIDLTWKQATRHSFVSRLLASGVALDEVSAAVGHSSPMVTKRYYDHFIRKTYSKALRSGLGLKNQEPATIISMQA